MDEALSHRKHVDSTIEAIGEAIFGANRGFEVLKTVRPSGQPIVDDWDCFKTLVLNFVSFPDNINVFMHFTQYSGGLLTKNNNNAH